MSRLRPKGTVKPPRLTADCRAKALEAGLWQRGDGEFEPLRTMHRDHLVNALLRALLDGDPKSITEPLAKEIRRRRLKAYAFRVCSEREGKKR